MLKSESESTSKIRSDLVDELCRQVGRLKGLPDHIVTIILKDTAEFIGDKLFDVGVYDEKSPSELILKTPENKEPLLKELEEMRELACVSSGFFARTQHELSRTRRELDILCNKIVCLQNSIQFSDEEDDDSCSTSNTDEYDCGSDEE